MGADRQERVGEIDASPDACYAILLDFESWPDWQPGLSEATVLERDAEGRGVVAAFAADAVVKKIRYTVRYTHEPPHRMSWVLVEGDVKAGDGEFLLDEIAPGRTRATYRLVSDLGFYVPGPLRRKGTELLMGGVIKGLQQRAAAS
ncbi:MAG TPA: SRPBCC family protein [Solirubrobacteraceae bacterium]|jgi:ribosome-associated toxin RatA of RatAB toxin-antitoxin module